MTHARHQTSGRNVVFGVLGVALLTVVGCVLTQTGDAPVAPEDAAATRALTFRAGDRAAYRLRVESRVTLDPDQQEQRIIYDLEALLCTNVLSADGKEATVAMQLRNVSHRFGPHQDEAHQVALGVPFVVRFDGGMPQRFSFPAALAEEIRSELRSLVRTFQVTLPANGAAEWTARENDETGEFRAAYRGTTAGGFAKRKAAYLHATIAKSAESQSSGTADVTVLESNASMLPAVESSWLERAEALDELELAMSGDTFARSRSRSSLTLVAGAFDPTSDIAGDVHPQRLLEVPAPAIADRTEIAATPQPITPGARQQLRDLITRFTDSGGADQALIHEIAALLERFPELAHEIAPRLRDTRLAGTVAAGLTHALQLAGNDTCQQVLGNVCLDVEYPVANRMRAIVALGGLDHPNPAAVGAAWQVTTVGGTRQLDDLATSALLTVGAMGRALRDDGGERYEQLIGGLRVAMSTTDPDRKAVVLRAIANTSDPALLPQVAPELRATSTAVRSAAISAISCMDRPKSLATLTDHLALESDGRMRGHLVRGMGRLNHRRRDTFVKCADHVRTEEHPEAKKAIAYYLADNLAHYPESEPLLRELMKTEQRHAVRRYVKGRLLQARVDRQKTPKGARGRYR